MESLPRSPLLHRSLLSVADPQLQGQAWRRYGQLRKQHLFFRPSLASFSHTHPTIFLHVTGRLVTKTMGRRDDAAPRTRANTAPCLRRAAAASVSALRSLTPLPTCSRLQRLRSPRSMGAFARRDCRWHSTVSTKPIDSPAIDTK